MPEPTLAPPPDEPAKRERPWQWPKSWWHDEKFWRETATRTVSGLLVVLIGYLTGRALGYFTGPSAGHTIKVIAVVIGALIGAFFLLGAMVALLDRFMDKYKWLRRKTARRLIFLTVFIIVLVYISFFVWVNASVWE